MLKLTTIVFAMILSALSLGVVLAADTVELVSVWNPVGAEPDGCAPALTGGGGPTKWRNVETDADDQLGLGVSEQSRDRHGQRGEDHRQDDRECEGRPERGVEMRPFQLTSPDS